MKINFSLLIRFILISALSLSEVPSAHAFSHEPSQTLSTSFQSQALIAADLLGFLRTTPQRLTGARLAYHASTFLLAGSLWSFASPSPAGTLAWTKISIASENGLSLALLFGGSALLIALKVWRTLKPLNSSSVDPTRPFTQWKMGSTIKFERHDSTRDQWTRQASGSAERVVMPTSSWETIDQLQQAGFRVSDLQPSGIKNSQFQQGAIILEKPVTKPGEARWFVALSADGKMKIGRGFDLLSMRQSKLLRWDSTTAVLFHQTEEGSDFEILANSHPAIRLIAYENGLLQVEDPVELFLLNNGFRSAASSPTFFELHGWRAHRLPDAVDGVPIWEIGYRDSQKNQKIRGVLNLDRLVVSASQVAFHTKGGKVQILQKDSSDQAAEPVQDSIVSQGEKIYSTSQSRSLAPVGGLPIIALPVLAWLGFANGPSLIQSSFILVSGLGILGWFAKDIIQKAGFFQHAKLLPAAIIRFAQAA